MQRFKNETNVGQLERITDAFIAGASSVEDPIVELSFLQGISNLFRAGAYNEKASDRIGAVLSTVVFDYINQWFPTLGGKINKVIDPVVRDTSTTQTGVKGEAVKTGKQIINKVWSKALLPKKDKWGREISRNDSPTVKATSTLLGDNAFGRGTGRLLDQLSPANVTQIEELDDTEKELLRIKQDTGKKILPTQKKVDKTINVNKEEYRLNDTEYNKAKEIFGSESKEMLDALVSADGYDKLASTEEGEAHIANLANDIYLYSEQKIKEYYCNEHNLDFEPTDNSSKDMYNTITAIEDVGGNAKDYFNYLIGTANMDKAEKLNYLNNMNVSSKVKDAIYANDAGTYKFMKSGEDEHYNAIKAINNKVSNSYIEYKQKSAENYFTNKNEKGEDVKGQKQKRVEDFINNAKDMTTLERYYIYVQEGYANKLTSTQRNRLREALKNNRSNIDEETYNSIIKKLDKADKK